MKELYFIDSLTLGIKHHACMLQMVTLKAFGRHRSLAIMLFWLIWSLWLLLLRPPWLSSLSTLLVFLFRLCWICLPLLEVLLGLVNRYICKEDFQSFKEWFLPQATGVPSPMTFLKCFFVFGRVLQSGNMSFKDPVLFGWFLCSGGGLQFGQESCNIRICPCIPPL